MRLDTYIEEIISKISDEHDPDYYEGIRYGAELGAKLALAEVKKQHDRGWTYPPNCVWVARQELGISDD